MTNTSLFYLDENGGYEHEKPFFVSFPVDDIPEAKQTNIRHKRHDNICITNIRGHEQDYSLDSSGFEFAEFSSKFAAEDFKDFEAIREEYFNEVQEFLKQHLKADWVRAFDCDIRRRSAAYPDVQFGDDCQPVQMVHVDYSYDWAIQKARRMMRTIGETRSGRIQQITIWKPLIGPVRDWPLAMCDYRSINQSRDAVHVDQVYPNFIAENINFYHGKAHKWVFAEDMQPSEAWLIKIMDTEAEDAPIARNCPHSAFAWHDAPPDRFPRESIEVRALVFTADKI